VLQQTPRTVIGAPPSEVILPPLVAEVAVIALIERVLTAGTLVVEFSEPSVLLPFLQLIKKIGNKNADLKFPIPVASQRGITEIFPSGRPAFKNIRSKLRGINPKEIKY